MISASVTTKELMWMQQHTLDTYHATQLAALVTAAGAFLVAAPLTSKDQLGCNAHRKRATWGTPAEEDSELNLVVMSLEVSPSVWMVAHGTSWKRMLVSTLENKMWIDTEWKKARLTAGIPTCHGLGATSASDSGGQGAGPAASFMAQLLTKMNRVWNNISPLSGKTMPACVIITRFLSEQHNIHTLIVSALR